VEQRRLPASPVAGESIFQAMLDAAPDAMIGVNSDGIIVMANAQTEVVFGYEPDSLLGEPIEVLVPEDVRDLHPTHRSEYFREPRTRPMGAGLDLSGRRADGSEFPAEISLSSIRTEDGPVSLAAIRDVTDRVAVEDEIREAREEADRANQAKSDFLSRVSHELRTPLNSILGFGQLLEMEKLPQGQRRSVLQILEAGAHLLDLINEILDIEKIASGRMTLSLEPVHVGQVLDEALKLVRPIADQDGVHLIDPPEAFEVSVQADRQRLKQVFLNLLSNAVKFNRVGGEVRISGETTSTGSFRITVTDTGQGIAPEMMSKLFTPFSRLGAERGGIEGIFAYRPSVVVLSAMQGSIGMELARRHQPDLILLDLHLPDMSGEEVFQRLKTDEATSAIPIVIVSADASAETLGRLQVAGASSFITKPLNVGHFLETIDGMLGRS
jgi:PAS domain S-box-containing protein